MVASIQGHFDPWHPRIIDKTEVQLDAILEAYAEDNPKKLKFNRSGTMEDGERVSNLAVEWSKHLIGSARDELRRKYSFKLPEQYNRARPTVRQAPSTDPLSKVVRQMPKKVVPGKR